MLKWYSKLMVLIFLFALTANGNLYAFQLTAKFDIAETEKEKIEKPRVIETTTFEITEDEVCECEPGCVLVFPRDPFYVKLGRTIINPFKKIRNIFVSKD